MPEGLRYIPACVPEATGELASTAVQGKVYKVLVTDLDELKQRLRTEWDKLDHVVIAAAIRQQWRRKLWGSGARA